MVTTVDLSYQCYGAHCVDTVAVWEGLVATTTLVTFGQRRVKHFFGTMVYLTFLFATFYYKSNVRLVT